MTENVLATRYASPEMVELWDPVTKVRLERELWLTMMETQRSLGVDIDPQAIADYRAVMDRIDLGSIVERERILRHDVKARIEEFNSLAGHEAIHLAMTSRDLTENVEQTQIRRAMELVLVRAVAALHAMSRLAADHAGLAVTGRTHNVPAQVTTVGKRIATAGEELARAVLRIEDLLARYPLRGVKGPVGTQQDQAELLGSAEAAADLDSAVVRSLGFDSAMGSVGQVYPRSLDLEVVSALTQLAAGPSDLTITLRLMAGHDQATEGFRPGQVGSSAMPHKMNPRTSERVHGFKVVLTGHLTMAAALAGEQWNEGDVSDSVVRRVMLPDAFYAIDGLFQSFLTILSEVGFHPCVIEAELAANLPFLATSRLLAGAVRAGAGREAAHETIQRHALEAATARRQDPNGAQDLLASLAEDESFPLDDRAIQEAVGEPLVFSGLAGRQVEGFVELADEIGRRHPAAANYRAEDIV